MKDTFLLKLKKWKSRPVLKKQTVKKNLVQVYGIVHKVLNEHRNDAITDQCRLIASGLGFKE